MTTQPVRLDGVQIEQIAEGLVKGRYFAASMCPPDMMTSVFPILALLEPDIVDWDEVGNVIEEMDKAGPLAVNGYPMFFSAQIVHKDDWAAIIEKAEAAQQAMDAAIKGSS